MRRTMTMVALVCLLALALGANAQDKPKTGGASGKVKSVDVGSRKVILERNGEDTEVVLRSGGQIFREEKADKTAVEDGRHVQADGTLSDDKSSMAISRLFVYVPKGRGFEVLNDKRADGKLSIRDGKWFVTAKGQEVELKPTEKTRILTRTWVEPGDIETGASAGCWGNMTDSGLEASLFYFSAK